jgi:hypothetical protein
LIDKFQMLGPALMTLFQAQAAYYTQASELLSGLGKYRQIGDIFRDDKASRSVKEATAQWLAAVQTNACLRKNSLSHNDVQCILCCAQGLEVPDDMKSGLNSKIDRLLQEYKRELDRNALKNFEFLGGFHLNPKGIELALEGCCSGLEAKGAGGLKDELSSEETMAQICRDTSRVEYRIGQQWFEAVPAGKTTEGAKAKLKAICEMVKRVVPCPVSQTKLEEFAITVLNETCSTVSNCAARTAVQLVFGVANLVLVKPSSDFFDSRPTVITCQNNVVRVEVSSCWWLVEDTPTLCHIRPNLDPSSRLGSVEAVYQRTFSVTNGLATKDLPLPIITIRWQQELAPPKSPTESASTARSLRNSLNRVSMRITSKLNRHNSEKRGSGSWKDNVCPPHATFQSYVDLEEAGKKVDNDQAPNQLVGADLPVQNTMEDRMSVVAGVANEERWEGGREELVSNWGGKQEIEETTAKEGDVDSKERRSVVEKMGEAKICHTLPSNGKVPCGWEPSAESTAETDDMQKSNSKVTDTHLASQAELQSVIDFLSGYPASQRSLQQMGNVGVSPYSSVPFNYDFEPDLFDGFLPPQQWPRSSSGINGRSSFNGRSGSLGRNRGNSLGRSSRGGAGYSDVGIDDVTPYGYDVIYEVTNPLGSGLINDRLTSRPVRDRLDFTSGFDMAQQGIDPVRFPPYPPYPHEQGLFRSSSTDFLNGISSRQSSLSPHQNLASPNNWMQQGSEAEVASRSPATWPREKPSPWSNVSSSGHSHLHQTFSVPGAGFDATQGKARASSGGTSQTGQQQASPRTFSSDSSSPSGSPPTSPDRSVQQQIPMSYAASLSQHQRGNGARGKRSMTQQQTPGGLAYLQDWEKQWNFQQQDMRRMPQT